MNWNAIHALRAAGPAQPVTGIFKPTAKFSIGVREAPMQRLHGSTEAKCTAMRILGS
jgi:hypothetical protein